ncbi:MAG: hypothetical protein IJX39_08510, partial [Clostridia bacterium]|nr:hypothetical protein [Clostridia bacterium]
MKIKYLWHLLALLLCMCMLCSCFGTGDDSAEEEQMRSTATNFGIGYGYDVLNSPYFESGQVKKRNAILDLEKAKELINKTQQSSSTSGGICEESVENYSKEYEKRLTLDFGVSGEFSVFSKSVGLSFDASGSDFFSEKVSSAEKQVYYTYFDDVSVYYLEMKNYTTDTLQGMLSDFFIKDINRQSTATAGMTDAELAKYLMDTYGTHLITGLQMGGRLEYSYIISTSNSEKHSELKSALKMNFEGGLDKMLKYDVEGSEESALATLLNSEEVRSDFTIRRYGGKSTGLWTYEELQANYNDWANSLNEEKYQNAVGIAPYGMVALWNLIPAGHDGLVEAMRTLYRQNGLDAYNTNLENLRPTV